MKGKDCNSKRKKNNSLKLKKHAEYFNRFAVQKLVFLTQSNSKTPWKAIPSTTG